MGTPISVVGELPQLSGNINSMSGFDMHTINVSNLILPGYTSVDYKIIAGNDQIVPAGIVLATTSFERISLIFCRCFLIILKRLLE